ncbi:hypothetical protein EXIGLDRAFT_640388 [Exidia glandulosa HHB12029]|uniref:GH16 domain-containing protein n=1 Tax=Exidia glandulosa HHB12029 TaxID=1314781 RepID=A0A165MRN1_EXIGL|nr:hypothetical protein EXIGLDRAFT_640388 [Exidia glandulosa HHB12029]
MTIMRPALFATIAAIVLQSSVHAFDLVREYQGDTFFDDWDFYGFWDNLTNGDVEYLNRQDSFSNELVSTTSSGSAIMRVDNFTNVPSNYKRNSIRITSTHYYDTGSLWVFDIKHLPYGCSVWPSIWTHGDNWPNGGEIDIIEGINLNARNQVAVHTLGGCTHQNGTNELGWAGGADCSTPSGCTVQDPDTRSYGAPFAAAGGGVWAAQYDVAGIFIWFFTRNNMPISLNAKDKSTLDIGEWGPPLAAYPSSSCEMAKYFTPQQLVIDITLCGDWAGVPSLYNATCKNTGPTGICYTDNVIGPGAGKYDNAYFEINAIRAYTTGAPAPTSTSTSASSSSTSTGSSPSTPTGDGGGGDSSNVPPPDGSALGGQAGYPALAALPVAFVAGIVALVI